MIYNIIQVYKKHWFEDIELDVSIREGIAASAFFMGVHGAYILKRSLRARRLCLIMMERVRIVVFIKDEEKPVKGIGFFLFGLFW